MARSKNTAAGDGTLSWRPGTSALPGISAPQLRLGLSPPRLPKVGRIDFRNELL
jgi:hypothetical protein